MKFWLCLFAILALHVNLSYPQVQLTCNRPADCPYGFYCHTYLGEPSVCIRCINCGDFKRNAGTSPCATNILEDCGPCLFGYRDKTSYDAYRTEHCTRSPHYRGTSGIVSQSSITVVGVSLLIALGTTNILLK